MNATDTVEAPAPVAVRRVGASHGWRWIGDAFALFRREPVTLIGMTLIWFAIAAILSFVPFLGTLALTVLSPILFGGFMLGCDKLQRGESVSVAQLFAAFARAGGPLALVGLIYIAGMIGVSLLTVLAALALGLPAADPDAGPLADPVLAFDLALAGLLSVPLMMALWFAPALIALCRRSASEAIRLSFTATVRNLPAFLLFLLVSGVITLLAAIPFFLGLLIWAPIAVAAAYAGYRDIFGGSGIDTA